MASLASPVCSRAGCAINTHLTACTGCNSVQYCSPACRESAAKTHDLVCANLADGQCREILRLTAERMNTLGQSQNSTKPMTLLNEAAWKSLKPRINACLQDGIIPIGRMAIVSQQLEHLIISHNTALQGARREAKLVAEVRDATMIPSKASPEMSKKVSDLKIQVGVLKEACDLMAQTIQGDLVELNDISDQLKERLDLINSLPVPA